MNNVLATFDVDAQKGFTPLCPDELPIPGGAGIVDELNIMASLGDIRVGSKDAHPKNPVWLSSAGQAIMTPLDYPNADLTWPSHCVVGTKGNELLDGLPSPVGYDYFVWKGMERDLHPYGACYHDLEERMSTGVIEYLTARHVTHVIVGGLAYEHCVATTARQLRSAGFEVALYEPAVRGLDDALILETRAFLQEIGVVILKSQEQIIAYNNRLQGDD